MNSIFFKGEVVPIINSRYHAASTPWVISGLGGFRWLSKGNYIYWRLL